MKKLDLVINSQEPFQGDIDEFLEVIHHPQAYKISNLIQFAAQNWEKCSLAQKQEISKIIEDFDLSEDFNETLGVNNEVCFKYHQGQWESEDLDFFKINLDIETASQLKSLSSEVELKLKLNPKKVLTFEPILNNLATEIISFASQKTVQLTIGLALLSFTAFNFQSDLTSLAKKISHSNSQVESIVEINHLLPSTLSELNKSSNPDIVSLKKELSNFNFKPYADSISLENNHSFFNKFTEADELLIEEVILHFYEEKNPGHIDKIKPHIPRIAKSIIKHSEDKKIDFRILLGILKTESDFSQNTVSSTGDFSLAQINYRIWSDEFKKVKNIKLNKDKLKKDIDYSISMMTEILNILEKRHPNDPLWYARYHSSTPSLKIKYAGKVDSVVNSIKLEEYSFNLQRISSLITKLNEITPSMAEDNGINIETIQKLVSQLSDIRNNYAKSQMEIASN
jgi:hypothetical protein